VSVTPLAYLEPGLHASDCPACVGSGPIEPGTAGASCAGEQQKSGEQCVSAGHFEALAEEASAGFHRIIGLDLSEIAVDGSVHKAPSVREGTGKSPVDRNKGGSKWSIATDRGGIPLAGQRRRRASFPRVVAQNTRKGVVENCIKPVECTGFE
jgi:hypothetical protein